MSKTCPSCGGNLVSKDMGYKCRSCGKTFDSEEEIAPKKKKVLYSDTADRDRGAEVLLKSNVEFVENKDHGADVFSENINGVLEITWSDGVCRHSGSGFLITRGGYAITNTHVVTTEDGRSCKTVNVKLCGENTTAEVIRLGDDKHGDGKGVDLALIKINRIPQNAKILKFENFENVRIGERVFVIGNSLGYGTCMTSGIVSDKTRNVNGKMLMMTDCAVNGGNSGGPVFNENGLVIGVIVSGITDAEGMNFAIPSSTVQRFIESVSDVNLMQQIFEGESWASLPDIEPFAGTWSGVYTGRPGDTIPPPVGSKPGGRFWGIGVQPPQETIPGGQFKGLPKNHDNVEAKASCSKCPQCGGTNFTYTEGDFYWCGDCYCEW